RTGCSELRPTRIATAIKSTTATAERPATAYRRASIDITTSRPPAAACDATATTAPGQPLSELPLGAAPQARTGATVSRSAAMAQAAVPALRASPVGSRRRPQAPDVSGPSDQLPGAGSFTAGRHSSETPVASRTCAPKFVPFVATVVRSNRGVFFGSFAW